MPSKQVDGAPVAAGRRDDWSLCDDSVAHTVGREAAAYLQYIVRRAPFPHPPRTTRPAMLRHSALDALGLAAAHVATLIAPPGRCTTEEGVDAACLGCRSGTDLVVQFHYFWALSDPNDAVVQVKNYDNLPGAMLFLHEHE